jgi:gliding motility-associated-like protein
VETGTSGTGTPVVSNLTHPSGVSYTVEVTSGICTNASLTPLPLTPGSTINVSFDLSDICNGNITAVTAPAATTFDWSASEAGSLTNPLINAATVNVNSNPAGFVMVLSASNGVDCPGTHTQRVTVETVVPDFTPSTCVSPVVLTATPSGNYLYDWSLNGAQLIGNNQINATTSGDYRVDVTSIATGCPAVPSPTKPIDLNVLGPLTVQIDPFNNGVPPCPGVPFTLTAVPNRTVISYQWSFNTNVIPSSNVNPWTDTREGDYKVMVSDGTCSVTSSPSPINFPPPTPSNLPDRATICPDPNVFINLTPGPGFTSYRWFRNNGAQTNFDDVPTFPAESAGTYTVVLVDNFSCPSTDETIIIQQCEPILNAPTAFKPITGQGENRTFRVFYRHVSEDDFLVFIFNRWGEMVYQSSDLNFTWNGTFNNAGPQLPAGTYSWVAKYKGDSSEENKIREKRGGVVLIR